MNADNQRVPTVGPESVMATCCVIGCERRAAYLIYTPPYTDSGYAHACEDHVEDLKSTDGDAVERL